MTIKLRNGIFLAPFHPVDEDPTLCLQRDLELIEHLDRLGYDEAWIGEHHSAGYEIIASPEVFIAAAAERTKRIMLGTGVVSLPYHNPLMTANRIIQLDHQTRGRVMFGVGPGLLPSDAFSMGIDPSTQRDRMVEVDRGDPAPVRRRARDAEVRLVHPRRRDVPAAALHLAASGDRGRVLRHAVGRQARRQARLRHAVRGGDAGRAAMTRSASTGRSPTKSPPRTAARWIRRSCAWSVRCTSPRRATGVQECRVRPRQMARLFRRHQRGRRTRGHGAR